MRQNRSGSSRRLWPPSVRLVRLVRLVAGPTRVHGTTARMRKGREQQSSPVSSAWEAECSEIDTRLWAAAAATSAAAASPSGTQRAEALFAALERAAPSKLASLWGGWRLHRRLAGEGSLA